MSSLRSGSKEPGLCHLQQDARPGRIAHKHSMCRFVRPADGSEWKVSPGRKLAQVVREGIRAECRRVSSANATSTECDRIYPALALHEVHGTRRNVWRHGDAASIGIAWPYSDGVGWQTLDRLPGCRKAALSGLGEQVRGDRPGTGSAGHAEIVGD
jgi:hypothetical protein